LDMTNLRSITNNTSIHPETQREYAAFGHGKTYSSVVTSWSAGTSHTLHYSTVHTLTHSITYSLLINHMYIYIWANIWNGRLKISTRHDNLGEIFIIIRYLHDYYVEFHEFSLLLIFDSNIWLYITEVEYMIFRDFQWGYCKIPLWLTTAYFSTLDFNTKILRGYICNRFHI